MILKEIRNLRTWWNPQIMSPDARIGNCLFWKYQILRWQGALACEGLFFVHCWWARRIWLPCERFLTGCCGYRLQKYSIYPMNHWICLGKGHWVLQPASFLLLFVSQIVGILPVLVRYKVVCCFLKHNDTYNWFFLQTLWLTIVLSAATISWIYVRDYNLKLKIHYSGNKDCVA